MPFGIQATQIHLNYWKENDFENFKTFVKKNKNNFITYDQALEKVSNKIHYRLINEFTKALLKTKRFLNFKS